MVKYVNLDQSSFTSDDVVRRFGDLETIGNSDKQDKSMNTRDTALRQDYCSLVLPRRSAECCLTPAEGKHHSTEQSTQCRDTVSQAGAEIGG